MHLTDEEKERAEYVLPLVQELVNRMAAAGVADPVATVRAAVGDRDAATAPILALARQVDPEALYWASEVGRLVVVHDFHDGTRIRLVINTCLELIGSSPRRVSEGGAGRRPLSWSWPLGTAPSGTGTAPFLWLSATSRRTPKMGPDCARFRFDLSRAL
jgi:hypothetical protein